MFQSTALVPAPNFILVPDTPEMERAFDSILNMSPVSVLPDRDSGPFAFYIPDNKVIVINPQADESVLFGALSREMALALYHQRQGDAFDRDNLLLEANSISRMLSQRFGLAPGYVGDVPLSTRGATTRGKARFLEALRGIAAKLGDVIQAAVSRQNVLGQSRSIEPIDIDTSR